VVYLEYQACLSPGGLGWSWRLEAVFGVADLTEIQAGNLMKGISLDINNQSFIQTKCHSLEK
jgi:hypothetical protein